MTEQKEETEKTPLYQDDKLIGYCTRVLLSEISEGLDVEYRYTIQDFEAVEDEPDQPIFEVGEYYKVSEIIYVVREVGSSQIIYDCFYSKNLIFRRESYASLNSNFCDNSVEATAEQIALFKRAEHFRSKGRKLNEFRMNDVIIDQFGDYVVVSNVIGSTIEGEYACEVASIETAILIMTAEELEAAVTDEGRKLINKKFDELKGE